MQAAEKELKERLMKFDGLTANQIWEHLNLSYEWNKYRREHDYSYNLPIFRAYYRLIRRGDLLTCGRKPGTFKEPVFILKEKVGLSDWTKDSMDEQQAIKCVVEKLIASLGVTNPVHVSHISGYKTAEILPVFEELDTIVRDKAWLETFFDYSFSFEYFKKIKVRKRNATVKL